MINLNRRNTRVLIVPFMELKLSATNLNTSSFHGLNRTFYGIETMAPTPLARRVSRLNRTFYGIETTITVTNSVRYAVSDSGDMRSLVFQVFLRLQS